MLRNILAVMLIMNGIAFYNTEYINNVGTVLFSTSDMDKRRWNTDEIGLLKARRYFQNLLPPPLFVSTLNQNYVDLLFNYFREAYSAIKRETDDPNMDRTMTTALSDSIGGYLKAWVLPVTKFAYYGGTISEQNVTTLFEFYDEIKRYLRTDGDGWHRPKTNLFDVSIKTADPRMTTVAEGKNENPCDHFVFFEKTPEGLNVPIPHVSWDGPSSKLFLPLKNHSIYSMNSTNSSSVLLKYYETARYCLQQRYPSLLDNFDARFQSWLANEVLPHLADDNVYLALGSVLTVMNKTRELYDNVLYMYEKKPKLCKKVHTFAFSKKMVIVTLLIVIEVVWCCVALFYACYSKRKKNKVSQVFLSVEPRHPGHEDKCYNTQEAIGRMPFGIKDCVASRGGEAAQTDIDTLFVRARCCNTECKCPMDVPLTVTQSAGITSKGSDASHPRIHNKKVSKRDSSQSEFSALCRGSTSNSAVPISSSKTIINAVSTESNRRLKHKTDKQPDRKDKHVKNVGSQKIENTQKTTETRKSKRDINVTNSKRELKSSDPRRSSRNKVPEVLKSKMLPDITKFVQVEIPSKEQAIDTTEFLKSEYFCHTTGTQNLPLLLNSSKNLNTDLSINNHMRHEECQYVEADKTSIYSTNTEKTEKSVSFLHRENKSKTETYAEFIADVTAVNYELIKKETLIIENPKFIEEKRSINLTCTTTDPEKYSPNTVEPQQIIEKSRHVNSRKQDFTTYQNQQKLDKECKDPKSKSSMKIGSIVSTPKRSKKLKASVEEVIPSRSSIAKKKKAETKSPRLSIQKEFKDIHVKEPYWKITIDEPENDVYVDIKGTIKIDSRNVKRSRIPKPSVRAVDPRASSNTPRATRAGSLIPQPKKKTVDDLVLNANAETNKLNTSI